MRAVGSGAQRIDRDAKVKSVKAQYILEYDLHKGIDHA